MILLHDGEQLCEGRRGLKKSATLQMQKVMMKNMDDSMRGTGI